MNNEGTRRARVRRMIKKRPLPTGVSVVRREVDDPARRHRLLTLLASLLDAAPRHVGK